MTPRQARLEKDERQRREKRIAKATVQVEKNTATTKAKHPTAHTASRTTATSGLYPSETLKITARMSKKKGTPPLPK